MALVSFTGIHAGPWPEASSLSTATPAVRDIRLVTPSQLADFQSKDGQEKILLLETETDLTRIENLSTHLAHLKAVGITFPSFTDGRGFSLAVRLRRDYGFTGEIRALGHVIPDQALFLLRSGFDTADVADARADAFTKMLSRYNCFYQSDVRGQETAATIRSRQAAAGRAGACTTQGTDIKEVS